MALVVGCLEAAEQLVERGQDLLGQLGRDEVLVLPALGEDGRQALLVGEREEPLGGEQHLKGGENRPARHFGHGLDGKGQVARGLTVGGVNQPQGDAVREQADRHLGLAQEPLETGLGAGLPAMVRGLGGVIEADPGLDLLEQQEPLRARLPASWRIRGPRRSDGASRCTR